MNPHEAYKNNSKLPTSVEDINQSNLLKVFQKIETSLVMGRPEITRKTISTLFDYINIEDNNEENSPVLNLVQILFYIYNYCDKHDKDKLIKLMKTLQEPLK